MKQKGLFLGACAAILAIGLFVPVFVQNQYFFFASYVILQYVALSSAWNILGGYTGYVNFGTPAFFAAGAYTTVVLLKLFKPALPVLLLGGGLVAGLIGLGIGYLTLRLRGVFFSIATLALAVVLQTIVVNWDFVGGAKGTYVIRPKEIYFFRNYVEFLFVVMLFLAVASVAISWLIEKSWVGRGLAAIRDNEEAADCMGVPVLKLKLFATTLSGGLLGVTGASFPYYITYMEPPSAFNLDYAVNSLAMPMIGGATSWLGPVVGAVLLGTAQQIATVTLSAEMNLLIVGVLLVSFVVFAPEGIVGLADKFRYRRSMRRR